jgi:hypothetical protein
MSTLRATRGDTTVYRFTCVDVEGAPVDLTNATAALHVRRYVEAPDTVIDKTLDDGLTVVEPASGGLIDLELEPADTADVAPGRYRWDLEVMLGDQVYTVDAGAFALVADVTRAGS